MESKPTIAFMIPLAPKENPNTLERVQINGYVMKFPKGRIIQVPLPVFDILSNKYNIASELGRDKLITRDHNVQKALE